MSTSKNDIDFATTEDTSSLFMDASMNDCLRSASQIIRNLIVVGGRTGGNEGRSF
jgi:hypothetical protein